MSTLALLGGEASAAAVDPSSPWGVFSKESAGESTRIDLGFIMVVNTAGVRPETSWIRESAERIWTARKRVVKPGAPDAVQWADSRTCYPLIETLATLVDLDASSGSAIVVEDRSRPSAIYRIEAAGLAPVGDGALRLKNGKAAPVRAIVDDAFDAWRFCWTGAPGALPAAS